ncbi:helix-turn-helix domain-containing protein [uncultured Thiothrix sp.]|uniref:helix-turn-helix domain-containing protein n=1 Tax=uncultured Thiothrix sp. TaxID=223185 RepID=UPI0026171FE2|nr:helix-turn-helix domain-containing protein [uncultured Thiothrix sp.]
MSPNLSTTAQASVQAYLAPFIQADTLDQISHLHQHILDLVEKPLLAETLKAFGANQSAAARALGINRATLRRKLIRHDLL